MVDVPHTLSPEDLQRIYELAEDLAKQEGIILTSTCIDECRPSCATDYHLLSLTSDDCSVTEKLHREELTTQRRESTNGLTEAKIRSALERLRMQLDD